MYKQLKHPYETTVVALLRLSDNASIPMDESNTDYQEYLKWVELGNTPEPAETE